MTATVFVIRAMSRNPDLSVMPDRSKIDQTDITQEEEDEETEEEDDGDDDVEGDEVEEEEEDDEDDDDDIGEAAEAVAVAVEAPINQKKRGSKSDTKRMTQDKTVAASNTHTAVVSQSSSSSSSSAKGSTDKSKSAVKGKGKLGNEQALEGEVEVEKEVEGKVEDEAVDGCRWVMQRLKGLGSDPRGRKRLHVIRVRTVLTCNCTSYLHRHHLYLFLLWDFLWSSLISPSSYLHNLH